MAHQQVCCQPPTVSTSRVSMHQWAGAYAYFEPNTRLRPCAVWKRTESEARLTWPCGPLPTISKLSDTKQHECGTSHLPLRSCLASLSFLPSVAFSELLRHNPRGHLASVQQSSSVKDLVTSLCCASSCTAGCWDNKVPQMHTAAHITT